jgi:hypothetical protein
MRCHHPSSFFDDQHDMLAQSFCSRQQPALRVPGPEDTCLGGRSVSPPLPRRRRGLGLAVWGSGLGRDALVPMLRDGRVPRRCGKSPADGNQPVAFELPMGSSGGHRISSPLTGMWHVTPDFVEGCAQ